MFTWQGTPIFQYVAMITGSLNVVSAGMLYGWSSVSLPKLFHKDTPISISNDEGSWVTVMLLIGCVVGSTFTAVFVDKFGRKRLTLLSSLLICISWIIMAYATNVTSLVLSRFLGGLGDGIVCCTVPIYFGEIASANLRGFINGFLFLSLTIGILAINILGSYLDLFHISVVASILAITCFFTFIWIPESPYYLIMNKYYDEAKISIRKFQYDKNVDEEFQRLSVVVQSKTSGTGKFFDLFTDENNRRAVYITAGTRSFMQLSGLTAITFYAQTIFKEFSHNPSFFKYGPLFYFGAMVVTSTVSALCVDKVGRKPLLLISLSGICLMLICMSGFLSLKNLTNIDVRPYELIPAIALIVYVICTNIGLQSIPFILTSEVFQTNVKAFGVCLMDIYGNFLGIAITKLFQFTNDEYGLHVSCFFFLVCSIFGCFFVYFCVPETKGKTLEEIQEQLKIEKSRKK